MTLLIYALAPSIAILFYIYNRDKYDKEPRAILFKAFILGAISVIPVVFIEMALTNFVQGRHDLLSVLFISFAVAGLVEEGAKYTCFVSYIWRKPAFDEAFDGIVYCVFISLGFATVENIAYVFQNGYATALIRAVTAVPAHAIFGITMGYYLGIARFIRRDYQKKYLILGIVLPILLHGFYDFILLSQRFYLLILFIPYMIFLFKRGMKNIAELVETSPYKYSSYDSENHRNDNY